MAYPGYPQQGGYPPQQGGYPPQPGGYPGQQPSQPGKPGQQPQPGYGTPGQYPQPGYGVPGQPHGAPGAPAPYPGQPGAPGQYPGQPYPGQPGAPGQYPGQPGAPTQPGQYSGQPGHPGAPGHHPHSHQQPNWTSSLYDQIPPHELQRLQQWFAGVDRDRSGSISAPELAQVVFGGKPIGVPTATKLIKIFDRDNSGTIDFREYAVLNQYLMNMFNAFVSADRDRSGYIDAQEIHHALSAAGFQLSLPTLQALVQKFSVPGRGVDISNFLFICAHLGHLRSIFEWNDQSRSGKITLTYDALTHIGTEIL